MNILQFLTSNTNVLWAGLVSAVVSTAVSYLFKRSELRDRLRAEYEQDQRKRLRELIGRYHGRMLQAAISLDRRFGNLYVNYDRGWLIADGKFTNLGYFYLSTIYRFLNVCTLIRQFELEALFLDARIAESDDFMFLNYLGALQWALTDIKIFRGLEYNDFYQTAHFFSDNLRNYCDSFGTKDQVITFMQLSDRLKKDRSLDGFIEFFDGLTPKTQPLRWDRLVIFHLLLVAFINSYGYKVNHISNAGLANIVKIISHRKILENFLDCLGELGLNKSREAKRLRKVSLDYLRHGQ